MATKVRIEWNNAGFAALLRHPALVGEVTSRASAIADAAGDGFDAKVTQGRDRVRAVVQSSTDEAKAAEATDKVLTRAIGAGRG